MTYKGIRENNDSVMATQITQELESGSSDYTKEKYERPDISHEEAIAMIKEYERTKAAS